MYFVLFHLFIFLAIVCKELSVNLTVLCSLSSQVYIYQRWIYRVDPTRVNEFGVSLDDPTGEKACEKERQRDASVDGSSCDGIVQQNKASNHEGKVQSLNEDKKKR